MRQPSRWPGGRGDPLPGPGSRRAEQARDAIAAASGSTSISYGLADLKDLDAVRAFARRFRATHDRLDVLIHNAGVIHRQFRTDGPGPG